MKLYFCRFQTAKQISSPTESVHYGFLKKSKSMNLTNQIMQTVMYKNLYCLMNQFNNGQVLKKGHQCQCHSQNHVLCVLPPRSAKYTINTSVQKKKQKSYFGGFLCFGKQRALQNKIIKLRHRSLIIKKQTEQAARSLCSGHLYLPGNDGGC